jgi:hypothetical protein
MSNTMPPNEAPEANGPPRGLTKPWIVLGLLVLAHAVLGAYFNPNGMPSYQVSAIRVIVILGVFVSQPFLFAIWASLAQQRLFPRLLWSILLCILVSLAEDLATLLHPNHRYFGMSTLVAMTLFFLATIVLSLFRRFSRWQIKQPNEDASSVPPTFQFGIKHLLILTTITAVACGLFRTLYVIAPTLSWLPPIARDMVTICLSLALLFPVIIIPWFTLTGHRRFAARMFIPIVLGAVFDLAVFSIMSEMSSPPQLASIPGPVIRPYLLLQLGFGTSVFATTLVVRFCGFRMIREPRIEGRA